MKKSAVVVGACSPFPRPGSGARGGDSRREVSLVCTDPALCENAVPPVSIPLPVTTDAEGAFSFEGLAAAPWQLEVVVAADPVSMTKAKSALIDFAVMADQAPAKLAGDRDRARRRRRSPSRSTPGSTSRPPPASSCCPATRSSSRPGT